MSNYQNSQWTNDSVLAFSKEQNPIKIMEETAKRCVLEAMEKGWTGPPFDPIKLAEYLKINVTANADVIDARTFCSNSNKFTIEYNPNQPKGRVKFSIAHEIAHTFFPDCKEKTRYRHKPERNSDDWQIEMLCNIGASEIIMPIGSISEELDNSLNINQVLKLRREFDVSVEALLIRLAKLSNRSLAVFCASRINGENSLEAKFRIDYLISSKSWPYIDLSGMEFKSDILGECTAIGYTVSGNQNLNISNKKAKLYLECVGLPPYPGNNFPRIAGILYSDKRLKTHNELLRYHDGDATHPGGHGQKIIAHIVNDKTPNWGGRGFAQALKNRYRDVQDDFKTWVQSDPNNLSLSNFREYDIDTNLKIVSMIAQHGYGPSSHPRVRYLALEKCLKGLKDIARNSNSSVHMPKIGTGNAGGDWGVIKELIDDELVSEGIEVNVYEFGDPSPQNYSFEL